MITTSPFKHFSVRERLKQYVDQAELPRWAFTWGVLLWMLPLGILWALLFLLVLRLRRRFQSSGSMMRSRGRID